MPLIWLIAFVVFLVVEGVTTSLTSIWFVGGSLAALVVQMRGGGLYPQLAVSVVISFMLSPVARLLAYKYLYGKWTKTNVDSLTSRKIVVKDHTDNVAGTGTAILAGETWLARAAEKGDIFEADDVVVISAVSGTKLLVAIAKQEHEAEKVQRNIRGIHMFGTVEGFTTFIVTVVIILFVLPTCIRAVSQAQALVVERLGAYLGTHSVGIHFLVPLIDRAAKKVNLKEQVEDFPPQPVTTKDNVTVRTDTVVSFYITGPKLYVYGVERPLLVIENLAATTSRNIAGDLELDETLTSREIINTKTQEPLDIVTDPWGIKVTRVELKNITPPAAIQEAMEKQMKVEREHRESVPRTEGEKKSMVLVMEGHRESVVPNVEGEKEVVILTAEAEKEKKTREAEGQTEVIRPVQKATADGIRFIKETEADDAVPQLESLEAFQTAANGKANKIIIPLDIQGIAGPVKSIAEVASKDEAAE